MNIKCELPFVSRDQGLLRVKEGRIADRHSNRSEINEVNSKGL